MIRTAGTPSAWSLALVAALVLAACSTGGGEVAPTSLPATSIPTTAPPTSVPPPEGPDDPEDPDPDPTLPAELPGGTLVWVHDEEPIDLHVDDPGTQTVTAAWIRQGLWEGLFGVSADDAFTLELLADEPTVEERDDGSMQVDFVLREGLSWSDGTPLTSTDAMHTLDVLLARDDSGSFVYLMADRKPYEGIVDYEASSETEFSITWGAPYGGWRNALAQVHPAHVFADDPPEAAAEANEALREWAHEGVVLPSSGPLEFESWSRGLNMRLVRNPNYHGSTSANAPWGGITGVDAVLVRFVADEAAIVAALEAGEAGLGIVGDVRFVPSEDSGLDTVVSLVPSSHLLMIDPTSPHLADPLVRRALSLAIDRQALADRSPGRRGGEGSGILVGSALRVVQQTGYVDLLEPSGLGEGDVLSARLLLFEAGYGFLESGTAVHLARGPLSLSLQIDSDTMTTDAVLDLVDSLRLIGVEIELVAPPEPAEPTEPADTPEADPASEPTPSEGDAAAEPSFALGADLVVRAVPSAPWPGERLAVLRFEATDDASVRCQLQSNHDEAERCLRALDLTLVAPEDGLGPLVLPLWQDSVWFVTSSAAIERFAAASLLPNAGPLVTISELVPV